ncbi:DNA-deoxyinosine glycosylase [Mycolicibacterium palauense]|uniref:DNA-deoxyinosine glycosylase n=1 Tax=Mycolicibacterium palauense TaxID=2034511 RepID=UPI000BFEBDE1|nr:DNA-deoxyinosine glycosylase [Mycolicibacterium palauense]
MGQTLHGFAPLVGESPRLLVLGNMPSVASLAAHQYYGNPRNVFWRIMGELYGFDAAADYRARVAALTARRVAVWDVLASCRRAGSLDSAVERDSMVANDFAAFFAAHPGIDRIYFNGAAAETNYRRLVGAAPRPSRRLPSTSPAHTLAYADKLAAWRVVLT